MKERLIAWWLKGVLKGGIRTKLTAWVVGRKLNAWLKENEMGTENSKSWWKSKTIWINALTGIAGVLTAITMPDAGLDPKTVGIVGSILAALNIVLRLITDEPIKKN